jgi:hypothetical protein
MGRGAGPPLRRRGLHQPAHRRLQRGDQGARAVDAGEKAGRAHKEFMHGVEGREASLLLQSSTPTHSTHLCPDVISASPSHTCMLSHGRAHMPLQEKGDEAWADPSLREFLRTGKF